jgi:hypothetical protein
LVAANNDDAIRLFEVLNLVQLQQEFLQLLKAVLNLTQCLLQMGLLHNALGAELVDFLKGSESAEQALSDVEAVYETAAKDAGYL